MKRAGPTSVTHLAAVGVLSATLGCGADLQAPVSPAERGTPAPEPDSPVAPGTPGNPGTPGTPGTPITPDGPTPPADRPFSCAPDTPAMARGLARLSYTAYRNALLSLAEAAAGGPIEQSEQRALESALDALPPDVLSEDDDYPSLVVDVGQAHVDAYHDVGQALGNLFGATAADRCSGDCSELVTSLMQAAFRRPPTSDEVAFMRSALLTSTDASSMGALLSVLAQSPDFIYRLEDGVAEATGRTRALTSFELASRLSFHFWNAPPDTELLEAAASGALDTEQGYAEQVERLFASPRTRDTMHNFFGAWLKLQKLPSMDENAGRADFAAYAGDELPDENLTQELVADLLGFIDHVVWDEQGSFVDLFTSRSAVLPSPQVASLYGVPFSEEPVELDPNERAGLLTRPALLAYNQATTRPIMRGVKVRVRLACAQLELPDMMDDIQIPAANPGETTRARIEDLTEQPGSTCASCHALINPFGFVLERYDALGRVRDVERVFGDDGTLEATHPIDLQTATPLDGREVAFTNPVEMSAAVGNSQEVQRCFARHYFRYTFGRQENLAADGCALEGIRSRISEGAPLAEALRSVAYDPAFRQLTEEN